MPLHTSGNQWEAQEPDKAPNLLLLPFLTEITLRDFRKYLDVDDGTTRARYVTLKGRGPGGKCW